MDTKTAEHIAATIIDRLDWNNLPDGWRVAIILNGVTGRAGAVAELADIIQQSGTDTGTAYGDSLPGLRPDIAELLGRMEHMECARRRRKEIKQEQATRHIATYGRDIC